MPKKDQRKTVIHTIDNRHQGEQRSSSQYEAGLNWNNVFPTRYLEKYWEKLSANDFPIVLLKELSYIVAHIKENESRVDRQLSELNSSINEQHMSLNFLLNSHNKLKREQALLGEQVAALQKMADDTKLTITTLRKELILAKTYPVNGSAIRLSPAGVRRKIRSNGNKVDDRAT